MTGNREKISSLLDLARRNLERDGELAACMIVESADTAAIVLLSGDAWGPTANERKETCYRLGITLGFGLDAQRIYVIVDAYMKYVNVTDSVAKVLDAQRGSLADDPASTEVILVHEWGPEGYVDGGMLAYERLVRLEGTTFVFKDPIWQGEVSADATFGYFFVGQKEAERVMKALEEGGSFRPAWTVNEQGETRMDISRRVARTAGLALGLDISMPGADAGLDDA